MIHHIRKNKSVVIELLLVLLLFVGAASANEKNGGLNQTKEISSSRQTVNIPQNKYIGLLTESSISKQKLEMQAEKIKELQRELSKVKLDFDSRTNRDLKYEYSNFSNNAGIALSAASILVTVVGVVVAILAFIGFRQVTKKAEQKAIDTANRILKNELDKGTFDELITSKLNEIAMRGIWGGDELDKEQEENEEAK
ncbi:MAG: hypothetical protein RI556_02315 [Hydrogenovibrio sp.]|uniref:hypothetical protein n=1 Tax=Hydrogenovibrio sp. TaxID=2065821 RepID=UPI00286FEFB8|nr:hypothetical protein [Hydrogenovibrio sp.]MDR9497984.1 hypothetical protein [Hydrogenovibrio sp.]